MKLTTLATALICFVATVALSNSIRGPRVNRGGADGAGGDLLHLNNVMWFTGKHKIIYCVQTDPAFGISADKAEAEFLEAVEGWKKYVANIPELGFDPRSIHKSLPPESKGRANLRFEKISNCDGYYDLQLLFGVENAKVLEANK